ncbi:MAG: hypothetical protein ACJA1A_002547 [Saprospiraceae bacterium]|jgi:hypothetical protein|tara:strand:- start:1114 stop:1743 length:630 start_codon:yes stop_codon:yes gene_type:complete
MKKIFFGLLMMLSTLSYSQFELGVKTGISSFDLTPKSIIFNNGGNDMTLSIKEAKYGFHFGLYTRVTIANIFIEPAFLFNSSSIDYNLSEEIFDTGIISSIRSESYNNLDIPLMIGIKVGPLRLQGGPVAHIFLNSSSDLIAINGYSQKFKDASYGIQGGIGLDFLKVRLDFNYETNLSLFGDHINVDGQSYDFDQRPGRFVASVGVKF